MPNDLDFDHDLMTLTINQLWSFLLLVYIITWPKKSITAKKNAVFGESGSMSMHFITLQNKIFHKRKEEC